VAITRRTAVFAQLAESVESCLDLAGYPAQPADVDRVLNTFLEVRSAEMGVAPRSMLAYFAAPEDALRVAQNVATWFGRGAPSDEQARDLASMRKAMQQVIDDADRPNT
jgi:hypothetical protein